MNDMPVIVLQLPEQLKQTEVKLFLSELQPLLESERPRIVLDCSQVRYVDSTGVEMLRQCLQEATKRDEDLRFAAVSPASGVILELIRVDGLFETFATTEEAVQSFYAFASHPMPQSRSRSRIYEAFGDLESAN